MVLAGRSPPGAATVFHKHVERCDACSTLLTALAAAATAGAHRALAARTPVSPLQATDHAIESEAGGAPLDIRAGACVHQYELIRELGRGGMGMVWAAR